MREYFIVYFLVTLIFTTEIEICLLSFAMLDKNVKCMICFVSNISFKFFVKNIKYDEWIHRNNNNYVYAGILLVFVESL